MTPIEERNKLEKDTKVQIKDELSINQSFYTDGENRIDCVEIYYFDQIFACLTKQEVQKLIDSLQNIVVNL